MALKQKKKIAKSGAAKNYITRTQAVRKLQISLADFRRLCIFKGIYPREPRNKKKINKGSTPSTTFYYAKDIQYLFHEPLLAKFREHKTLAKKIGRALGRNEVSDAVRLEKNSSRMTLDHLVKERYPTFVDALRDLDDALSMLFLFASLPSTSYVPAKTIALCQRLCLEFQHYLIVSRSLRKSFLSIKGIYYQATIQGQDIMWLVPYKFVQKMAGDIDFRIMATFIEFYTTLMGFINYRLYTTVGLVYPPKFDSLSDEKGGELGAFKLQGRGITASSDLETNTTSAIGTDGQTSTEAGVAAQAKADQLALALEPEEQKTEDQEQLQQEQEHSMEALDSFKPATTQDADILLQPTFNGIESGNLFADTVFFLSRESPKGSLEFILRAFGCNKIGWDVILGDGAYTTDEKDPRITHQIVDRPPFAPVNDDLEMDEKEVSQAALARTLRVPGRVYVQPQWIWDCINQGKIVRPDLYAPGATLPPHLSPWVKAKPGVYDPTLALEEQEKEGEAELAEEDAQAAAQRAIEAADQEVDSEEVSEDEEDEEDVEEEEEEDASDAEIFAGEGMQVDLSGDEDAAQDENSDEADDGANADDDGLSESEDEGAQYQRELEAEAAGLPVPAKPVKTSSIRKQKLRKEKAEKEELDRQRMMMSNKKRKLFDKMQFSNRKTDREAEKLRQKRRKIESQKVSK